MTPHRSPASAAPGMHAPDAALSEYGSLAQQQAQKHTQTQSAQSTPASQSQQAQQTPSTDIVEGILVEPLAAVAEDVWRALVPESVRRFLGFTPDPETQARQQQALQRYQRLNAEQQQYAQTRAQELLERREAEEQQQKERRAAEQAAAQQSLAVPTGKKDGPEGMGGKSRSQQATQMVSQMRNSFNNPGSAN